MKIPSEKPSVIYPIGSILEDERMIMEVLEFLDKPLVHLYKVKVIQWKVLPPKDAQDHMDMEKPWIVIVPDSIPKIKVIH